MLRMCHCRPPIACMLHPAAVTGPPPISDHHALDHPTPLSVRIGIKPLTLPFLSPSTRDSPSHSNAPHDALVFHRPHLNVVEHRSPTVLARFHRAATTTPISVSTTRIPLPPNWVIPHLSLPHLELHEHHGPLAITGRPSPLMNPRCRESFLPSPQCHIIPVSSYLPNHAWCIPLIVLNLHPPASPLLVVQLTTGKRATVRLCAWWYFLVQAHTTLGHWAGLCHPGCFCPVRHNRLLGPLDRGYGPDSA
jgi:hypothetical protein